MVNEPKINIYPNDIYEIENFISDQTIDIFLSYVNLDGDEGWEVHGDDTTKADGSANTVSSLIANVAENESFLYEIKKVEKSIIDYFTNPIECLNIIRISRRKVGEWMRTHTDLGPQSDQNEIRFGAVIYLNDDYDGGELYYNEYDFMIKPKKGSLVIHNSRHPHKVLKVKSGTKYSMTTFIIGDETTFCNIK